VPYDVATCPLRLWLAVRRKVHAHIHSGVIWRSCSVGKVAWTSSWTLLVVFGVCNQHKSIKLPCLTDKGFHAYALQVGIAAYLASTLTVLSKHFLVHFMRSSHEDCGIIAMYLIHLVVAARWCSRPRCLVAVVEQGMGGGVILALESKVLNELMCGSTC
jgi:hypothetical protein